MPKGLAAETCRADAKKNHTTLATSKKLASPASQVGVLGTKSVAPVTVEKTGLPGSRKNKTLTPCLKNRPAKLLKSDHETKLKSGGVKKSAAISAKTRSGVRVVTPPKDASNARSPSEQRCVATPQPSKMKDKAKVLPPSAKESIKCNLKDTGGPRRPVTTKNLTKKTKQEPSKSGTADVKSDIVSASVATLSKKEAKKRCEQPSNAPLPTLASDSRDQTRKAGNKSVKKTPEITAAVAVKKESLKMCLSDEVAATKKEEQCVVSKKRIKHKCAADGVEAEKRVVAEEKSLAADVRSGQSPMAPQNACSEVQPSLARNVKFFKSKSRKMDKCKDTVSLQSSLVAATAASDGAFSVYDNLDEDSEELTTKKCPKRKNLSPSKVRIEMAVSETVVKSKRLLGEGQKTNKVRIIKDGKAPAKKAIERQEKRRLESDSEQEADVKAKKVKRGRVAENAGSKVNDSKEEIIASKGIVKNTSRNVKSSNKKATASKRLEDAAMASSSSDNAPLNRLVGKPSSSSSKVARTLPLKQEALSDECDRDSTSKKSELKKVKSVGRAQAKQCTKLLPIDNAKVKGVKTATTVDTKTSKVAAKKSVRFAKEERGKLATAKPLPQRRQRMASLNALAMVHCMYENESKNVSVSSFDSTENSDDTGEQDMPSSLAIPSKNMVTSTSTISSLKNNSSVPPQKSESLHAKSYIQQSLARDIELDKSTPAILVKFEPNLDQATDPVICRESLRMAPGLRSIGKHWDMNGSSISSTLSDDNETSAVAVAVTVAASTPILPPASIVAKECQDASFLEKPASFSSKKKFSRALRRPVLDDSSEEEKHQALLMEEKQRMMQRRRRQRSKEIAMDLKDMVVCKRMASLNATAILAASYSSSTGPATRRTIAVKSATAVTSGAATSSGSGKSDEKRLSENTTEPRYGKTKIVNENFVSKIKNGRGKQPLIRKKFSSSSDADIEDEADVSGSEVVVKTASSSGKQQVSLIVNQDSGVTITGLYLNSTTKSTHRQGYCSISGMQYRISSTSHTQTEATTVTTEAVGRTPQEPLRTSMPSSMHVDRQDLSPGQQNVLGTIHSSPIKTYTPLSALSNMQPPGSPHHMHHHHHHHHPKAVTIASSTQEISSSERHGCPSAFSSPSVYGPPQPPPSALTAVATRPSYPLLSDASPEPSFVAGYYQPAGPLISHHHHHHHHHHHVQTNSAVTTSVTGLPTSTATSAAPSSSTLSFTKVSQSPLVQPPTPPASNVAQPTSSELSDSEMASATTPAAEITVSESATEETGYPLSYRFASSSSSSGMTGPSATTLPPFRSPSHNYQTYYPSPPSTASLSHQPSHQQPSQTQQQQQQQQSHFQEILYNSNPSMAPLPPSSGGYHHGYLPVKGPPYPPPHTLQRRYIPALSPQQQYFHHEYPTPVPLSAAVSQQQVMIPAHPLAAAAAAAAAAASDPYHSAPSTPSIIESYPPPLPPPPPLYYSGYSSAPPTPYYPYATSSRSLTLVETSCPCPLQTCQKNVDTGPLTGFISKGPVEQRKTPLSPVALSLPKEPHDIRSLPSPARGSAGSRPTPSPAIATAKNPTAWSESCCDYGCDTAGLLAISKASVAGAVDSAADLDSGIDGIGDLVDEVKAKRRSKRQEYKKMKLRRFRSARDANDQCLGKVCSSLCDPVTGTDAIHPMRLGQDAGGGVAAAAVAACLARTRANCAFEWCDSTDASYVSPEAGVEQEPLIKRPKQCSRWHQRVEDEDDPSDPEMPPKLYPEVDVEYQNRLRRGSGAVDGEPPAKKSSDSSLAQLLDGFVDVEKSNYLSALELRSVSDSGPGLEAAPVALSASALVQSLSPLNGYNDKRAKVNAVEKTARSVGPAVCVKHAPATRTAPASAARGANVDCAPCCASKMALALGRCQPSGVETRKSRFRRKRWTTKKRIRKKKPAVGSKSNEEEKLEAENAERRRRAELLSLTQKRATGRLKWSNGWTWLGEPFVAKIFMNTESSEVLRTCYHAMKHQSGDIIRPKDCILLRSGSKKTDLPYVAKVAHLWEDPEDGEMMMSLFWYYRPEHTEHDAKSSESPYELYASKHKDVNSVACIEDKCYVLTFNEYCRYHKSIRQNEESVDISSVIVPPLGRKRYPRLALLPPENTSLDLVYFCRKIYDFRQHRLLKNPFFV